MGNGFRPALSGRPSAGVMHTATGEAALPRTLAVFSASLFCSARRSAPLQTCGREAQSAIPRPAARAAAGAARRRSHTGARGAATERRARARTPCPGGPRGGGGARMPARRSPGTARASPWAGRCAASSGNTMEAAPQPRPRPGGAAAAPPPPPEQERKLEQEKLSGVVKSVHRRLRKKYREGNAGEGAAPAGPSRCPRRPGIGVSPAGAPGRCRGRAAGSSSALASCSSRESGVAGAVGCPQPCRGQPVGSAGAVPLSWGWWQRSPLPGREGSFPAVQQCFPN